MVRDLEFTDNEKAETAYDIIAGILAVIAVFIAMFKFSENLTPKQEYYIDWADNIIYFIFLADFIIRMGFSGNKKKYLKNNWIDLIAVIPFNFITSFKYGHTVKLARVFTYLLRLVGDLKEFIFENKIIYGFGVLTIIIITSSVGIYLLEEADNPAISNYGDALWFCLVTVSTVGYGDITVTTFFGRLVAGCLILTGIGFLTVFTGSVTEIFLERRKKIRGTIDEQNNLSETKKDKTDYFQKKNSIEKNKNTDSVKKEQNCIDLSTLNEEDRTALLKYYTFLISQKNKN